MILIPSDMRMLLDLVQQSLGQNIMFMFPRTNFRREIGLPAVKAAGLNPIEALHYASLVRLPLW